MKLNFTVMAQILSVLCIFVFLSTPVYAETIVHTSRERVDVSGSNTNSSKIATQTVKMNSSKNKYKNQGKNKQAVNKQVKPRLPVPYTYEQAVDYAEMYPEDITLHRVGVKDRFGNFCKNRFFDFLGKAGLHNSGMSFWGTPDCTFLRLTLNYGPESDNFKPCVIITWGADYKYHNPFNGVTVREKEAKIAGEKDLSPRFIKIVFESGYEKTLSTESKMLQNYYRNFNINDILLFPLSLFLPTSIGFHYQGNIELTNEDIWDIYRHGDIANVYLDDGYNSGILFFYSGEKQEEHKRQLTYGFEHIARLMNLNNRTIAAEREQRARDERREYREQVRAELKDKVRKKLNEEDLLEEVSEEVREEIRLAKEENAY